MTLSSTISRKSYDGDGSTASFSTVFVFDANEDVKVYLRDASGAETPWVEGTEYELTGANTGSAGTLTVETSPTDYTPASGEKLILIRDPSQVQESPFPLGGPFPSEVAERANDRQVMLIQALQEKLNRTPKFSVTSSASGAEIPDPDEGKSLVWGASGNLENGPTSDEISAAQGFASAAAASASSAADSAAEAATFDPDNYVLSPVSTTENNVPQWDSASKKLKGGLAVGTSSGNIPLVGTKSATESLAGLVEFATEAEQETGTATDLGASVAGIKHMIDTFSSDAFATELLHVRDERTSGTSAGDFTAGAARTRTLNTTKTNEITGASRSGSQITLPAGDYFCMAFAPAYSVDLNQAYIYNTSDSSVVARGTTTICGSASGVLVVSTVLCRFTLAAEKTIELRHECQTTKAANGFGAGGGFGTEVYAEVLIWKVG